MQLPPHLPPREKLQELLVAAEGLELTASNLARLSAQFSPEQAAWAMEQWRLRARATTKFSRASRMLFVREALEQASSESLARFHASLFVRDSEVVDATMGIGADTIALAEHHKVVGCEIDPERAAYAEWNLGVYERQARVVVADALTIADGAKALFADPGRREAGRRVIHAKDYLPSPYELLKVANQAERVVFKLSPFLSDATLQELGEEVLFVSESGECKEAVTTRGGTALTGVWSVHLSSGLRLARTELPALVQAAKDYVFDLDPAVIRAHAQGHFGCDSLGVAHGFLTGDIQINSPVLMGYRVLEQGSFDLKRLRRALQNLDSSTPTLKQRGTKLDLIALRKQLIRKGSRDLAILFWPVERSIRFAIAERL